MTSRRVAARNSAEKRIIAWFEKHPGQWWRITDVAAGAGLKIPVVTSILIMLKERGVLIREDLKWKRNGKPYPVYRIPTYAAPEAGPSWLCPIPPTLTPDQIKGIRTVLGFTGDIRAKRALDALNKNSENA